MSLIEKIIALIDLIDKNLNTINNHSPVILITGVAGYIGHHILEFIIQNYSSFYLYGTFNKKKPIIPSSSTNAQQTINYIHLDLQNETSITKCINIIFQNQNNNIPDIIIHCAAITSPTVAQKNMNITMKINCPKLFVDSLLSNYNSQLPTISPLFIFLSTDHVYDGKISIIYNEQSSTNPINNYGKSKIIMEKYLLNNWNNLVILRSSIVYGPKNKHKTTILNFVINQINDDKCKQMILFKDEKRNFVCIWDIIKVIQHFMKQCILFNRKYHDIYNCGGEITMNRVEFGYNVANIFGLSTDKIVSMNRSNCTQKWAHTAPNPKDLSMSSAKLYNEMNGKFNSHLTHIAGIKIL